METIRENLNDDLSMRKEKQSVRIPWNCYYKC